jgi:rhodanese-related sulfurtransferase
MSLNVNIKQISFLLLLSIALALSVNYFSPTGIPLFGQWDTEQGVITANAMNDAATTELEIREVEKAKSIFDEGSALFVDARSPEDYYGGHIPGAESFPVGQFEEQIEAFLDRHPPEQAIVTYCSGRTCEDSHHLAQLLNNFGFDNVTVFIDGFPGWEAEGYPVER